MQDYSYLIHNATLLDGFGGAAWRGALAVQDNRIARIDTQIEGKSYLELDARGLCLAPAFILAEPQAQLLAAETYFSQGIATIIGTQDEQKPRLNCVDSPELFFANSSLESALIQAKAQRLPLVHLGLTQAEIEDFSNATQRQTAYFLSATLHPRALPSYEADGGFLTFLTQHPLEQAVQRLTSHTAHAIGLLRRGELVEGYYADLVLFDPQKLSSPSCVQAVWVNGVLSYSRGKLTGAHAGHEIKPREMKRLRPHNAA